MTTITSTEAGATGRYIDLGSPASQDDLTAQTIIAYLKPASNSVIGYVWAKGDSAGNGPRMILNTAQNVAVGFGSSGVVNAPSMIASTTTITFGTWQHWQATHDGTVNASGINFYLDAASASTPGSPTNGSGTFGTDASYNEFLMNRTGLGREYVGDVAYIARWNRVLNSTERQNVRDNGPLSEPSGLVLCWANDQDYSSNAITASARSTRVTGSTPTNTALGGTSNQTLTPILLTNTSVLYAATVSVDQTLTPGLFSNTNTFYVATVALDSSPQTLTPDLFTNSNAFYGPTISWDQTLTPGLFSNANAFYGPTVVRTPGFLTPAMKNNAGTPWANETGITCNVYNQSTGALVLHKTGLTADANGVVSVTDNAMVEGTTYDYNIKLGTAQRLPTAVA